MERTTWRRLMRNLCGITPLKDTRTRVRLSRKAQGSQLCHEIVWPLCASREPMSSSQRAKKQILRRRNLYPNKWWPSQQKKSRRSNSPHHPNYETKVRKVYHGVVQTSRLLQVKRAVAAAEETSTQWCWSKWLRTSTSSRSNSARTKYVIVHCLLVFSHALTWSSSSSSLINYFTNQPLSVSLDH